MDQTRGLMLKMMREQAKYTQEALARDAACSVRSIQRAEAGEPVDMDTLKSIGAVLGFDGEAFLNPPTITDEDRREAERLAKEWIPVRLAVATTAADWNVLGESNTHYFDCLVRDDRVQDAAADLESHIRDCSDVWAEVDPRMRREAAKELAEKVTALEALGAVVSFGVRRSRVRFADGTPFDLVTLIVVISPKDAIRQFAMIPRNAQIQLT